MSSRRWYSRPSSEKYPLRCRSRLGRPIFPTARRGMQMPDEVIYYAVVNDLSSRDRPAGLFRRTYTDAGGLRDEAFTRDLVWKNSSSLVSAERGDLENDFIEITGKEADQLMEQLRARWTGEDNG